MKLPLATLACAVLLLGGAGCSTQESRVGAGRSVDTPVAELEALAEDREVSVRAAVARNPRTSESTLWKLAQAAKGVSPRYYDQVSESLAGNPSASERVLRQVLENVDRSNQLGSVGKAVLDNPAVNARVIDMMARDRKYGFQLEYDIAQHAVTPPETLEYLVRGTPYSEYSKRYELVASHPGANQATVHALAALARSADAGIQEALLARADLSFESQWLLTRRIFTPWLRGRLYARGDMGERVAQLAAMRTIEAQRVLLEWHGTPHSVLAGIALPAERASVEQRGEASLLRQAVAVRALLGRLMEEHPGTRIDFFQQIIAEATYGATIDSGCTGFKAYREGLRFALRSRSGEPVHEFALLASYLPSMVPCVPGSKPREPWYVKVEAGVIEQSLRRVLKGARPDPFTSVFSPLFVAKEDTVLSWERLGAEFGWQGSNASAPKIVMLDGPGQPGLAPRSNLQMVVGRFLLDNLRIDGSIRHGLRDGILLTKGSTVYRALALP